MTGKAEVSVKRNLKMPTLKIEEGTVRKEFRQPISLENAKELIAPNQSLQRNAIEPVT